MLTSAACSPQVIRARLLLHHMFGVLLLGPSLRPTAGQPCRLQLTGRVMQLLRCRACGHPALHQAPLLSVDSCSGQETETGWSLVRQLHDPSLHGGCLERALSVLIRFPRRKERWLSGFASPASSILPALGRRHEALRSTWPTWKHLEADWKQLPRRPSQR